MESVDMMELVDSSAAPKPPRNPGARAIHNRDVSPERSVGVSIRGHMRKRKRFVKAMERMAYAVETRSGASRGRCGRDAGMLSCER
jgi:hypothetical protein